MGFIFKQLFKTTTLLAPRHLSVQKRYLTVPEGNGNLNIQKIGRVTCIGFNNPDNKNCLDVFLLRKLKLALENFENDSESLAGVLYGERGNFSHGINQNEVNENLEEIQELLTGITETFLKKPLIAAISGFAVGSAFDLALWCDFRIVEETSVMAAYARTLGMPISEVSANRLCTLVGFNRALDWVLTGRVVKAKEALDCGIASRIVACGTALGQAVNFANSLGNMPQPCLKADRATILSLSDKFSSSVKPKIIEEKEKYLQMALLELKQGVHFTSSGDVRRKGQSQIK